MKKPDHENRISPSAALQIANRAASLGERLAKAQGSPAQPCLADPRIQIWRQNAASGNKQAFQRTLEWDGYSEEIANRALLVEDVYADLPPWAYFLAALEFAPLPPSAEGPLYSDLSAAPAFAPLFEPFLELARRQLIADCEQQLSLLSADAFRSLQRHLISGLSQLAATALFPLFSQGERSESASEAGGRFSNFIKQALDPSEFEAFFLQSPVLARLLCMLSMTWVEITREFLVRLEQDQSAIASIFGEPGSNVGRVERLEMSLSDRHNGGRQVALVTFESGLRLAYKPKDLSLEGAYNEALKQFEALGAPDAPKPIRVLNRSPYGWVEFVVQEPVGSPEQAATYFRRAGALLCLLYVLEGSDCHMDNIVATSRGPVLIDVETLLQPRLKPWSAASQPTDAFNLVSEQLSRTVLGIGMLPLFQRGRTGELHDVGGLGGTGGYQSAHQRLVWSAVNTDAMRAESQFEAEPQGHNVVLLNGIAQNPIAHLDEVIAGFSSFYQALLRHRGGALDGILEGFKGRTARLIFRSSQQYALLLRGARKVELLRSGIDRSLALERVGVSFARSPVMPYLWPLIRAEKNAMEAMDVPFFSIATDSRDLVLKDGTRLESCCEMSSYDSCRDIIAKLSSEDMEKQIELIRASFIPPSHVPEPAAAVPGDEVDKVLETIRPMSPDALIASAVEIGRLIASRAIVGKDGFATWVSPVQWQPDALGQRGAAYYLYSGATGIAVFLAAICKVTGDRQLVPLITAACRPLAGILQHPDANQLLSEEGIGGYNGLGSIAYALLSIHNLIDEPSYLNVARRVARLITPEKIMADKWMDIYGGSAGAILSLLAIHAASPDPELLRSAELCGEHLLLNRVAGPAGGMAWESNPERALLAGFAHGAAGIAYALAKLHAATGREDFLQAAKDAITYERSIFDRRARNWPVLAPQGSNGQARFINSWCHGAPGVALARIGCLPVIDEPALREEIDIGLDTTVRGGVTAIDHLCCGNMGRIAVALTASEKLRSPRLQQIAAVGATAVLWRAKKSGRFALESGPQTSLLPGFFRGLSGIGYTLLRVSQRVPLPDIALLENMP